MNISIDKELMYDLYQMYKTKVFILKRRSDKVNKSSRTDTLHERKTDYNKIRDKFLKLHKVMIDNGLLEMNTKTRKKMEIVE